MERRSVHLPGNSRRTEYLAQTTSWHPTFEVLFIGRGRNSTRFFKDVSAALAAYGDVYILDLDDLPGRGPEAEVDGILGWTKATRVRKPLLVGCPASFETAQRFALASPQFTLGLAIVPGSGSSDEPGSEALVTRLVRMVRLGVDVVLSLRAEREPSGATIGDGLDELDVPHLDATEDGDAAAVAQRIRAFAASIKPSSPARARRPPRPWVQGNNA
jgi:hypothetical protein